MEKLFTGILVLNWKNGQMRLLKRKQKEGAFEIPVRFELTVQVPKNPQVTAKGTIEIPHHKVEQMVVESI